MEIEMPNNVPVMTMGGTVLFPQTFMQLHIFEERYRQMLADSLSGNRVFIVANRADGESGQVNVDSPPCPVATAGIIRMANLNKDGTSNVILQGISRVRIEAITQESPYRLVQVSPLRAHAPSNTANLRSLQKTLLKLIDQRERLGTPSPEGFCEMFNAIEDLDSMGDLAAHALCHSSDLKQRLLETFNAEKRLDIIIDAFRKELEKDILGDKLDDLLGGDETSSSN